MAPVRVRRWQRDDCVTGEVEALHLASDGSNADEWRSMQLKRAYCVPDNFDRRDRAQVRFAEMMKAISSS